MFSCGNKRIHASAFRLTPSLRMEPTRNELYTESNLVSSEDSKPMARNCASALQLSDSPAPSPLWVKSVDFGLSGECLLIPR